MRILQAVIVLFAIIGCLALALGGFYIYTTSQQGGENFLTKFRDMKAAETTGTVATPAATPVPSSEYASVIQDYQPTPAPTPVGAAPVAVTVTGQQPVNTMVAAAPVQPAMKTPAPNEGKIRNWPSGKKWVALTYDDGPHPEWTPKMIELLRSKNVKATFFLLGSNIERHPDVAKAVADNGFEIGNHTFTHPNFNTSAMTIPKIREEMVKTQDAIKQYVTGLPVTNMRPPFGNTGPKKLEPVCEELGMNIVCWNIDTDDWRSKTTADEMTQNVMKNLTDGSIILMHDKHQKTYDCTAQIIDQVRAKGFEFVTVAELFGQAQASAAVARPQAPAVAQQPVAAQPMATQPTIAPMLTTTLPAPPAQAVQPATGQLPVPGNAAPAVRVATPASGLDASKITQPPPAR